MPQRQNRVDIDIVVKGDAQEQIKQISAAVRRWAQNVEKLEEDLSKAEREAKVLPSALERMRLAVQEMRVGYVEGLGDMAEETLDFADVLKQAQRYAEDFAFRTGRILEGFGNKFRETFNDEAAFSLKTGIKAFDSLQRSVDEGLSGVFTTALTKNSDKTVKSWEKFLESLEATFYQALGRMASALVQENVLAPLLKLGASAAGGLLEAGKALLLAEGGLVTKPTLGVVGEAGPELVIPLKAAGKFVTDALVTAAKDSVINEAVLATGAGAGVEDAAIASQAAASAQGLAAAQAAVTGAALFLFADALSAAFTGNSAIEAAGDLLFGNKGPGLVQKGLSAVGLSAFGGSGSPFEKGVANIQATLDLFDQAVRAFGELGFTAQQLLDQTGGNPGVAQNLLGQLTKGKALLPGAAGTIFDPSFFGGDAGGRFLTGPSLRLVGEAGPEHVLNVDSAPSVRALTEGLRPIVRELFAGERGGGGITVNVDARGAFLPDERGLERLARMIEERLRAFQSRRVGLAGA